MTAAASAERPSWSDRLLQSASQRPMRCPGNGSMCRTKSMGLGERSAHPGFHRSLALLGGRLRPGSLIRACALRLRGVGAEGGRCLSSHLSFPHHLVRDHSPRKGAVKARQAVSSPSAAGRTTPGASSLTAPLRPLLGPRAMNSGKTVATRPTGFFVPTPPEDPKKAPNLGIRWGFFNRQPCQEKDHASCIPFRQPLAGAALGTHPLSDEQIRTVAPSIFAQAPHGSRSERYSYIPTATVLAELRGGVPNPSWCARPVCGRKDGATSPST